MDRASWLMRFLLLRSLHFAEQYFLRVLPPPKASMTPATGAGDADRLAVPQKLKPLCVCKPLVSHRSNSPLRLVAPPH